MRFSMDSTPCLDCWELNDVYQIIMVQRKLICSLCLSIWQFPRCSWIMVCCTTSSSSESITLNRKTRISAKGRCGIATSDWYMELSFRTQSPPLCGKWNTRKRWNDCTYEYQRAHQDLNEQTLPRTYTPYATRPLRRGDLISRSPSNLLPGLFTP